MSTPIAEQPPPPPPATMVVAQQAYTARSGHGSVGPLIAVLAVITVMGLIAGMIGRLCSGGRIMGHGRYDLEGWMERKCASCLDGRVEPPRPNLTSENPDGDGVPVAVPVEKPRETEDEIRQRSPRDST